MKQGAAGLLMVVLSGCVTVRGDRSLVREEPRPPRCAPSTTTAELDPAARDKVRLIFRATERCEQPYVAVYHRPQKLAFHEAVRWIIAGGVGATFAVPSVVLVKDNPKLVPGGSDSGWVLLIYFLPALVLGGGTYVGLGATRALPDLEEVL